MRQTRRDLIVVVCALLILLLVIAVAWRDWIKPTLAGMLDGGNERQIGFQERLEGTGGSELVAYEPFDYPADGLLVGRSGGTGFDGPWEPGGFNARAFDSFSVQAGSLSYPGLTVRGSNHVSGAAPADGVQEISGVGRSFGRNIAVAGAKYYLSFLHRPDGEEGYASVVIGTGQGRELSVGKSGSVKQYHVSQRGGVGRVHSDVDAVVGTTAFIVVKMEFRDGPDRFTLYMNPEPGKAEPDGGIVKDDLDLEFADRVFLYSRSAWSVDEIRLGRTWGAVTPGK